jgi:antitoxin component YwqK of YwqJK toxin-antitoxin module
MNPIILKGKRKLALLIAILSLSTCCVLQVNAQDNCKAKLKANRNKSFIYEGKDRIEESYEFGVYSVSIKKGKIDTVSVHKGNQFTTTFLSQYGHIVSTSIDYLIDGVAYTDTLDLNTDTRKVKYDYYGNFTSAQLFTTYNHSTGAQVYYDVYGADSLYVNRYDNGQVQKMIWVNYGTEYARKQWNMEGKLLYEKYHSRETTYEPPGLLHSQQYDTLMDGRTIHCKTIWYENGAPESVAYFYDGKPCHVWSYYDRSGKLIKTAKKTPLHKLPMEVREPPRAYAPPDPSIFRTVSIQEAYQGNLNAFLHTEMSRILCTSSKELKGNYTVRTYLNIEGRMRFVSARGENIEAITPALQQMIDKMDLWKPTRENGRTLALVLDFRFSVTENK